MGIKSILPKAERCRESPFCGGGRGGGVVGRAEGQCHTVLSVCFIVPMSVVRTAEAKKPGWPPFSGLSPG